MKKLILPWLLSVLSLAFSLSGQAIPLCEGALIQTGYKNVLGDFRKNFQAPIVTQCAGTCYFESVVRALESRLTSYYHQPMALSRPALFASLMVWRLRLAYNENNYYFQKPKSRNGSVDFISYGSPGLVQGVVNTKGMNFLGPKSLKDIYEENKLLKKMYNKVGPYLYDLLHQATRNGEISSQGEADDLKHTATLGSLNKIETDLAHLLTESGLEMGTPTDKIRIQFNSIKLVFEPEARGSAILNSDIEQFILDRLKHGEELLLSYFHVKPYVIQVRGRDGFIQIPQGVTPLDKKVVEKKKIGGGHAVAVVDVVRDEFGHIQYLVIQNSWGAMQGGDFGYFYLSVNYLKQYGGSIYDLSISEREKMAPL